jgi:transposase
MDTLSQFIASTTDARELKRALAVQMRQQGYSYQQVASLLEVSESFISKWQQLYQQQGINALKLRYWGTQGYLDDASKQTVSEWLQQRQSCQLEELVAHLDLSYGVVFKSQQSYYDLLHQAGFSWKKTQGQRPQKDELQVAQKNKRLWSYSPGGEAKLLLGTCGCY